MRTIASTSGAQVTGITINDYQVKRATYHNERVRFLPTAGQPKQLPTCCALGLAASTSSDGACSMWAVLCLHVACCQALCNTPASNVLMCCLSGAPCLASLCSSHLPLPDVRARQRTRLCVSPHAAKQELSLDLQQGVSSLCKAVEGNFLKMPFNSSSYDAAYAIEATCHADKVGCLHDSPHLCLTAQPGALTLQMSKLCICRADGGLCVSERPLMAAPMLAWIADSSIISGLLCHHVPLHCSRGCGMQPT